MKKLLAVLLLAAVLIMALSVSAFAEAPKPTGASLTVREPLMPIKPVYITCPDCHKKIGDPYVGLNFIKLVADGFWDTECYVGWCPYCGNHISVWGKGIRD